MKHLRPTPIVLAVALLAVGTTSTLAFHDGGVAECSGCHSMHSAVDTVTEKLLLGPDQSSTCLLCHEAAFASSFRVSSADAIIPPGTAPANLTPGGDFAWIKKDYTYVVRGSTRTEDGDTHGHNIIASLQGYTVDARPEHVMAPGGSFLNTDLTCTACHDPHGKFRRDSAGVIHDGTDTAATYPITIDSGSYNDSPGAPGEDPIGAGEAVGVYRLLAGNGYSKGGVTYAGVPVAVAPHDYNRAEDTTQTRVAYGYGPVADQQVGWAEWCGTCHGEYHAAAGDNYHPTDETLDTTATTYKDYVKTGDLTGQADGVDTSYLSLVPFAHGGATGGNYAALAALANDDDSVLTGPDSTDLVTCLSCHRAHASGFQYALRWNPDSEFLTDGTDWEVFNGRTLAEVKTAYYERDASIFAPYQRSLCNKCHAQD